MDAFPSLAEKFKADPKGLTLKQFVANELKKMQASEEPVKRMTRLAAQLAE